MSPDLKRKEALLLKIITWPHIDKLGFLGIFVYKKQKKPIGFYTKKDKSDFQNKKKGESSDENLILNKN